MTDEIVLDSDNAENIKIKIGDIEDLTVEQVEEMGAQEAFEDGQIRIMPDGHPGKGSVVGFTMPVGDKVVPNTIGVDIGCGMFAARLPGSADLYDWDHRAILDSAIRERVPVGRNVHENKSFHMHEDFPWEVCQRKVEEFNENSDFEDVEVDYGPEYFDDLMERIYGSTKKSRYVIDSVGTLGGGNHFIEIGEMQNPGEREGYHLPEPFWVIVHSGSRNLGATICSYWQEKAAVVQKADEIREHLAQFPSEYINFNPDEESDSEVLDWVLGAHGDFVNYEPIPREERERYKDELKECVPENGKKGTDYDYLTGEYARGYIADMIYAQTYASLSRRHMAESVLDAWFTEFFDGYFKDEEELPPEFRGDDLGFVEEIESVHNYIDFEDQTIRKGATRAHDGERAIVPYNMRDGTLIVRGKGNGDWNNSINHGAGRVDSRGWAGNEITQEEANEEIYEADVFASIVPRDEAPHSYKNWEAIEKAMAPSAEIEERLEPLINIKAPTRYYDEE